MSCVPLFRGITGYETALCSTRCKYLRLWPLGILHRNSREWSSFFLRRKLNLYDNLCIFAMWTFLRSSYLNIACDVNFDDISSNIHLWRNRKCFSRLYLCECVCIVYDIDIDIQIKVHLKTNSAILNFNRIRYRFECAVYVSDSYFEYFQYRFRVIFEKEFNHFNQDWYM